MTQTVNFVGEKYIARDWRFLGSVRVLTLFYDLTETLESLLVPMGVCVA